MTGDSFTEAEQVDLHWMYKCFAYQNEESKFNRQANENEESKKQ